ncbi:hypothetical protein BpHYR1_036173 [Brachionus plicatilis]|uniref:Uncharacterized protein n=1 Tax=Brachionus plicatilis TaxID=10195 RepID=A0A3M7QQK3_BRAPC|nr:hypothetical protein BpHYR1_036173 [Brachionus plicatilis]
MRSKSISGDSVEVLHRANFQKLKHSNKFYDLNEIFTEFVDRYYLCSLHNLTSNVVPLFLKIKLDIHVNPSPDFKILNTEEEIYAKIATKF